MEALKLNYYQDIEGLPFNETYTAGFDKTKLHIVSWMPKVIPRAIVLFVHGSGDHVLRYHNWAQLFNCERIGFVGIDVRGHGKSGGKRGHGSLIELLKDIDTLFEYTRKMYPNTPRILYGQGMGGSLVMSYLIKNRPNVAGVVSASPWLRIVNSPLNLLGKLCNFATKLTPSLTLSNRSSSQYHTLNEVVAKSSDSDPLIHDKISQRLFYQITEAGELLLQNRHRFNVPILLIHGTHDTIASWRACSEFAQYTSKNTSFKPWDGGLHELHNSHDKENVFGFIANWIDKFPLSKKKI